MKFDVRNMTRNFGNIPDIGTIPDNIDVENSARVARDLLIPRDFEGQNGSNFKKLEGVKAEIVSQTKN